MYMYMYLVHFSVQMMTDLKRQNESQIRDLLDANNNFKEQVRSRKSYFFRFLLEINSYCVAISLSHVCTCTVYIFINPDIHQHVFQILECNHVRKDEWLLDEAGRESEWSQRIEGGFGARTAIFIWKTERPRKGILCENTGILLNSSLQNRILSLLIT